MAFSGISKLLKDRKGQVDFNSIPNLVMVLGAGAVLLATFLLVFEGVLDLDATTTSNSATDDNVTLLNGTAVSLSYTNISAFSNCVNNSNVSQTVPASNYSTSLTAGTITLVDNTWNNTAVLCDYTYLTYAQSYTTSSETIDALGDFGGWFDVLVIIAVAVIIMGAILGIAYLVGRR